MSTISLNELRINIDEIDRNIIELLSRRQNLVISAAQFKDCIEGETGVIVPSRIKSMIEERKTLADEYGMDSEFVGRLFKMIIDHMVSLELEEWKKDDCNK